MESVLAVDDERTCSLFVDVSFEPYAPVHVVVDNDVFVDSLHGINLIVNRVNDLKDLAKLAFTDLSLYSEVFKFDLSLLFLFLLCVIIVHRHRAVSLHLHV